MYFREITRFFVFTLEVNFTGMEKFGDSSLDPIPLKADYKW